jgi:hypothetical protein
MDELRSRLLEAAVSKFGEISPTSTRSSLMECFTEEDSRVIFWFNDRRGNTRAIVENKEG